MDLSAKFEELMQRSPISQHDMKSFLKEMRRTTSGTVTVSKLLAGKIQGSSEAQAIHAFEFLEAALESETEGSIEFRTEIGRYRFLNEIIRILSPKYLGDSTPEAIKERAVKFLEDAAGPKRKRWFPSEHSKVNSVYQSLIDGGILQKPSKVADEDAEFQKSIFERGENAVILKRLLQSKDPSDLQAANRLIKNLVDEEARRNERRAELHSLIDRIETSVGLLTEMLSQPNIDKEIVDELVDTCRNLRQKLGGVATETNDEVTSLLQASENIEKVLTLHESKKEYIESLANGSQIRDNTATSDKTLSGGGAAAELMSELSLADQLLMNLVEENDRTCKPASKPGPSKPNLDDSNLLLNLDIDLNQGLTNNKIDNEAADKTPELSEPFGEISKLSRELMEQGLKGMPNFTQSKKTDKTPLNQMKRPSVELLQQQGFPYINIPQVINPPATLNSISNSLNLLDLDILEKPIFSSTPKIAASSGDDVTSRNLNDRNPESKKSNGNYNIPQKHGNSKLSSSGGGDENVLLELEKEKSFGESNRSNGSDNNNKNGKINDAALTKDTKQDSKPQTITNSNGMNNGTTGTLSKVTDFCLNGVRDLDLEKIDLREDLKPLELSIGESCKDVSLTLTFGKYPEFPNSVCVAVVTFTNRNKSTGLINYVFQLLPPKGLQVKLLPPASMELAPWKKTFLPPPVLTQVALIVIPNSYSGEAKVPKIKFILSYCVEDETMLHNGEFSLPSCLLQ